MYGQSESGDSGRKVLFVRRRLVCRASVARYRVSELFCKRDARSETRWTTRGLLAEAGQVDVRRPAAVPVPELAGLTRRIHGAILTRWWLDWLGLKVTVVVRGHGTECHVVRSQLLRTTKCAIEHRLERTGSSTIKCGSICRRRPTSLHLNLVSSLVDLELRSRRLDSDLSDDGRPVCSRGRTIIATTRCAIPAGEDACLLRSLRASSISRSEHAVRYRSS